MIGTACTLEDACRQAQVRETIFKLEFFNASKLLIIIYLLLKKNDFETLYICR